MKIYSLIIAALLVFPLYGKTIRISQGESIQSAINKANAGDTIFVSKGNYSGNISINKAITLIGIDYPVIDGADKFSVFNLSASNITIKGFTIQNTGRGSLEDYAAIKANVCPGLVVTDNKIINAFFGIHVSNTEKITIRENQLSLERKIDESMKGNGIHLWKCSRALIENNSISGHRDGIYFEFVTHSLVKKNHSEGNDRYGLHFMFSHDDEYYNNEFVNNGAGVAVMYTHRVKMIGNRFEKNWGSSAYGLLLKDISDSHVERNIFFRNTSGLHMEGSSRIAFTKNEFSENGYAICLQASCDSNKFTFNNFSKNTFDVTTNGSLVLNRFDHNYWDHYDGYDLKNDGVGDVAFRPVSLYSMVVERVPSAVLLWRSFVVFLLDQSEKTLPLLTPENLKDSSPLMKPYDIR